MAAICKDCGEDTTPCTGKRGCRHIGRWEWYMVHDALWAAAGMSEGFLCISCLEDRLRRQLISADFTAAPINALDKPWDTPRLRARKLRKAGTAKKARRRLTRRDLEIALADKLEEIIEIMQYLGDQLHLNIATYRTQLGEEAMNCVMAWREGPDMELRTSQTKLQQLLQEQCDIEDAILDILDRRARRGGGDR